MKPFSFIHCADIHLGCRPFDLAERGADFACAFEHIVRAAIERGVDFVIIAGDLFHQRAVSADTLSDAVDALNLLRQAGIRCYCIEGNHDRAAALNTATFVDFLGKQGLLTLLKPVFDTQGGMCLDGASAYDGDCRIVGLGYLGATAPLRLKQAAEQIEARDDVFTVCALHAGHKGLADTDMSYIGTDGFEPLRGKAQYVALGHAHQMRAHDNWLFTPGAPEHVHIDEASPGRKGVFFVTVGEDGTFVAEHLPSAPRATRLLSLDVSGVSDALHVNDMVDTYLSGEDVPPGAVVRLRLYGDTPFAADTVDVPALEGMLRARGCLYAAVEVLLNHRVRMGGGHGAQSQEAFEHAVLEDMLLQRVPAVAGAQRGLADALYLYKEGRFEPEELLRAVENAVRASHAH